MTEGTVILGPVSEDFIWSVEAAMLAADVLQLTGNLKIQYVQELCRVWQAAEDEANRTRVGDKLFKQIKYESDYISK